MVLSAWSDNIKSVTKKIMKNIEKSKFSFFVAGSEYQSKKKKKKKKKKSKVIFFVAEFWYWL